MTHNNPSNRLLSRNDVEREYGLGRRWLELAAMRGDGPPMRRISARMIRYQRAELEAWLASRKVASTSQGCAK
jgi:predicted DNA-binding transcriptional regulator AlpA